MNFTDTLQSLCLKYNIHKYHKDEIRKLYKTQKVLNLMSQGLKNKMKDIKTITDQKIKEAKEKTMTIDEVINSLHGMSRQVELLS